MKTIFILAAIAGLLWVSMASGDTVYSWTDDNGVQRFSSEPPPEGIENFQILDSNSAGPDTSTPADKRRPSYDRMVQEASQEARMLEQQRKAEEAAAAEKRRRMAEAKRNEKIEAQRRQLQEQIDTIKKRALGPTFTQGMKKAQIDKIKKQIQALEKKSDSANPQGKQTTTESKNGY